MSYEYVVVPAGAVSTPGEVAQYFRSQRDLPLDGDLRLLLVPGLTAWNAAVPPTRSHARVRIEAAGSVVRVTAADEFDRRRRDPAVDDAGGPVRQLLEDLLTGFDYEIYDGRAHTLRSAPGLRVADVDIGGERQYSSVTEHQLYGWVPSLAGLAATPFLIVSRTGDPQTFIQTYRDGSDNYTVEIHDSAHTDHFFAARLRDPQLVARLLWEWAGNDWATLGRVDWTREGK